MKKGIKRKTWIEIYINNSIKSWDEIFVGRKGKSIHLYTRSDSCGAGASWANYLGKRQEELKEVGVYGDPGIMEAIRRDLWE